MNGSCKHSSLLCYGKVKSIIAQTKVVLDGHLNLEEASGVGWVDDSGPNFEALLRDVSRSGHGSRNVDAEVSNPGKAAAAIGIWFIKSAIEVALATELHAFLIFLNSYIVGKY